MAHRTHYTDVILWNITLVQQDWINRGESMTFLSLHPIEGVQEVSDAHAKLPISNHP